jgi:hypothetical protein
MKLTKLRKMLWLDPVTKNKRDKVLIMAKTLHCPKCGSVLEWVEKLPKRFNDHVP